MSNSEIPVTIGFDSSGSPAGYVKLSDRAKSIFEDGTMSGTNYVIAPGYLVTETDEEGNAKKVQLIELSLIPAANAVSPKQ